MSDPRLTPLKVEYGGEIHRIRVDITSFKFSQLLTVFQDAFSLQSGTFAVKYKDNEGDSIKVTSEEEFVEACTVFVSYANEIQSIRFTAVSIPMLKFQEATEPLMKALAALLDTLDVVKEKVEKEDWLGQCKRGLNITGEAISQAADDVRESFIFCKQKIKEYEMQGKINEAVNELGAATQKLVDGVQSSIRSIEKNIQRSDEMDAPQVHVDNQEPVETISSNSVEVQSADVISAAADTIEVTEPALETTISMTDDTNDSSENEWDVISSEEDPYASEIQVVKEIFPEAETALVISLLERYNRNVHITLNALAEM